MVKKQEKSFKYIKNSLTFPFLNSIIVHNYIDIRKKQKGFNAMQNMNRFSHHIYSVVPVNHYNQRLMFDGIYTVLQNLYNPEEII